MRNYLSKNPIMVTGNFRLKRDLILTTLRTTRSSSGPHAGTLRPAINGRTNHMAKAAKKPAAKKAAKKPAAKKAAKKPAAKKAKKK